jgi:hypothetical protein
MAAIARGPRQSTTTASSKFKAQTLKPKVSKLAEGLEMLSFANGDEFTGSKQQDAGINNHDFIHAGASTRLVTLVSRARKQCPWASCYYY